MSGLPASARSYDITRMSPAERRALSMNLMQAELNRQNAMIATPGLALPAGGMRRAPAAALAAKPVDASNPVLSLAGPPAIAGTLPDGLPDDTAPVAELVPYREMGERVENRELPRQDDAEKGRIAVGRLYGIDLDVDIDRTPRTSLEAHHAGARAFTTASGIFIPPEVGPLDSGPGEALLVHELTHVAQRQLSGGQVPEEASEEGRRLESEALRNEHFFAATRTLPVIPLSAESPRPPALPVARPLFPSVSPFAPGAGAEPGADPKGLPLAAGAGGNPFDVTAIADSVATMVTDRLTAAPATMSSEPTFGMQRAGEGTEPPADTTPPADPAPAADPGVGVKAMEKPSEEDLDKLTGWLWPLMRFRLRKELRDDRERAGLLTDLYRR